MVTDVRAARHTADQSEVAAEISGREVSGHRCSRTAEGSTDSAGGPEAAGPPTSLLPAIRISRRSNWASRASSWPSRRTGDAAGSRRSGRGEAKTARRADMERDRHHASGSDAGACLTGRPSASGRGSAATGTAMRCEERGCPQRREGVSSGRGRQGWGRGPSRGRGQRRLPSQARRRCSDYGHRRACTR